MSKFSRRDFLIVSGSTAAAIGMPKLGFAKDAQFTYKIGTDLPGTHPLNIRLQQASDAIKKETDGRLVVKLYPNNQLGGDPAMFSQLRAGALELFTLSGANVLSSLVPKAAISGVGFAFKDAQKVFEAFDGKLGARVRSLIEAKGLVVQKKIWNNGFRQISSSSHPIKAPGDLHGFKIRVPVGALWVSLFKALGAAPTGMSFNEVYSALQTKVVDGQENALLVVSVSKLYEVQKYLSMTNHMWDGFWLLGNKKAWARLPKDVQQIASTNFDKYAELQRQDVIKLNESLESKLKEKGMVFNSTDPAPFQEALRKAGFYKNWKEKFGEEEWALLEEVTGKLA